MAKASSPENRKKRSILYVDPSEVGLACDWAKEQGAGTERKSRVCYLVFHPSATVKNELLKHLPTFAYRYRSGHVCHYFAEDDVRKVFEFLNVRDCYIRLRWKTPRPVSYFQESAQCSNPPSLCRTA